MPEQFTTCHKQLAHQRKCLAYFPSVMTLVMSVCSDWEASDSIVILRKLERNIHAIVTEHSRKGNANFPVGKRIITRNVKLVIIFLAFNVRLFNDTKHFCCLHVPTTNHSIIYWNKKVCSSYCYGVQLGQGTLSTSQFVTFWFCL